MPDPMALGAFAVTLLLTFAGAAAGRMTVTRRNRRRKEFYRQEEDLRVLRWASLSLRVLGADRRR